MSGSTNKLQADFHLDWPIDDRSTAKRGLVYQLDPNMPSVAVFIKWGQDLGVESFVDSLRQQRGTVTIKREEPISHRGFTGRRLQVDVLSEGVEELPAPGSMSNVGMSGGPEQRTIFVVYEVAMCGTMAVFGYRLPDWEMDKRQSFLEEIVQSVRCADHDSCTGR
ncbi:MAG: hypothetical protein GY799_20685 [Desulfobulbaceae bacterium]|nr:hypothetical protein [Desulfobulbaceae bacterium]